MENTLSYKDRIAKEADQLQQKLKWLEQIILKLQEHLYIVKKGDKKIVKCDCGYEFGDYKTNWKYNALVYDRDPKEIYPGITGHDSEWCVYREFYCPGCSTQLEVEAVPHGMPFIFSTELELD